MVPVDESFVNMAILPNLYNYKIFYSYFLAFQ